MKFLTKKTFIFLALIAGFIFLFYYLQLSEYFTLKKLQEHHFLLKNFVQSHYIFSVLIYMCVYSILIACGLPIIIPLSLLGGFLYGILFGVICAGASCLIGSIISFLVLRYVVVHWVAHWHNERIEKFNQQINKYGYNYLVMLHFLSVIPLFVINLLAAIAKVPLITVIWVTIIGTFPLNLLCVIAGKQLSTIKSFKDIFSPTIIFALIILACIAFAPILIKKLRGKVSV